MKYGWLSGFLWALDTVLLGMVLSTLMPDESFRSAVWIVPLVSAWFHDLFSTCWLFLLTLLSGKLGQLKKACCTRHGLVVVVAAVLGGPVGMTGYLTAIENIGSGYTACISAFYPAFGALLARVFLKEQLHPIQYAGLLIALTGVMGIGWMSAEEGESFEPMIGIFAALICVVGWGSEAVLGSYAMRHETVDNHVALQIRNAVSAAAYGVLLWGVADVGAVKPFESILYLISGCALVGTMSYLFYYKAISILGASKGMALNITYSAWALLLGFVLNDGAISGLAFVFCFLIVVGTIASATSLLLPKIPLLSSVHRRQFP